MKKVTKFFKSNLHWLIVLGVALLCAIFLFAGTQSEDGTITLDGAKAQITDSTKQFIEDAQATLERIMNEDRPTDATTEEENDEVGLGFYTTIDDILNRRLADGDNDGGKGWQCSKYTAFLATGKKEYSTAHPDYGPVNGKDVAAYLVKNYGFKYVDEPVAGAIGSGGFGTKYGHTVMYLYSTGTNTAMVNDANWTPLKVSTHSMNIDGWVWVVPASYEPKPTPQPTPPQPSPEAPEAPSGSEDGTSIIVKPKDTLGAILRAHGYKGAELFGDNGEAERVAKENGIKSRGLIYPGEKIVIPKY